jgi:hypothetical protein
MKRYLVVADDLYVTVENMLQKIAQGLGDFGTPSPGKSNTD